VNHRDRRRFGNGGHAVRPDAGDACCHISNVPAGARVGEDRAIDAIRAACTPSHIA